VHPRAITIPVVALVPEGDEFKVFVVTQAGLARERKVTVGRRNQTTAEITSGLAAGERVVTEGAYGVEDSVKVVQAK
jgi:multidrug efflux pump subunit AcrA (membrane-fusion protein)